MSTPLRKRFKCEAMSRKCFSCDTFPWKGFTFWRCLNLKILCPQKSLASYCHMIVILKYPLMHLSDGCRDKLCNNSISVCLKIPPNCLSRKHPQINLPHKKNPRGFCKILPKWKPWGLWNLVQPNLPKWVPPLVSFYEPLMKSPKIKSLKP